MRKRISALILALAMCLGLSATALASEAEEALDVEGFEAIGVEFSDFSLIHPSENIFLSSAGEWSASPAEYAKITSGTQVTVSNTGTDGSAYVFIELDPYYYSPDEQSVDGQRTYYSMDDTVSLSSQGDDDGLFGPASNGLYWNYEWSEPDNVKLYPGSSVTFTLPEPDEDEDIIYVLWCYIYYPEYDCYFYRNYLASYSDLPHVPITADATPTSSTVLVNGENVSFDAYNINGNNYFKLRDLACVLSGTEKQFEVGWDGAAKSISLTSGQPYTAVGGEMAAGNGTTQAAHISNARILLNGQEISLTAYTINGNNYFKLRDIGQTFDFGVGWDNATRTITIDTAQGYTAG